MRIIVYIITIANSNGDMFNLAGIYNDNLLIAFYLCSFYFLTLISIRNIHSNDAKSIKISLYNEHKIKNRLCFIFISIRKS